MLNATFDSLTRAERQLANVLMKNYPVSGLCAITALAQSAEVSTPTVARLVHKLGFKGYAEFQAELRKELEEQISNPLTKHARWSDNAPDTHILNRFADAAMDNLRQTLALIDPGEFDETCKLLADAERQVFVLGGRITHPVAEYFCTHMQVARDRVFPLSGRSAIWAHYLLGMRPGDLLVLFDIRRYENDILKLAELAVERDVQIILFTDQWGSPISRLARRKFNCRVEVPSAWDSSAAILVLVETLIASVQSLTWEVTAERMADLERINSTTRLFRKFK
ncbi:MAG: MurR/RpiR family transcriptional regulator [Paracoccaceae bacterium]